MQSNTTSNGAAQKPANESTTKKYSWYERLITFTVQWTILAIVATVRVAFWCIKRAVVSIFRSRKASAAPVAAVAEQEEETAEPAPAAEEVVASHEAQETDPTGYVQAADFEAADWTCGLPLQPAVGVIHLRGYTAQCIVKRDLIINEPRLRAIMKGRRFSLPDALYNPVEGTSSIKDESVELAQELINRIGAEARTTAMRRGRPSNADQAAPQWAPWEEDDEQAAAREAAAAEALAQATAQASAKAQAQAQAMATLQKTIARDQANAPVLPKQVEQAVAQRREERQKQAATTIASTANVFQAQAMKGITYVGHIARSGMTKVAPRKGNPYEVFQVVVQLDNGAEMSFRGAEIEREMERLECQDGQRISITPMGQVPISLPGGGEGTKNLFRIETEFANA